VTAYVAVGLFLLSWDPLFILASVGRQAPTSWVTKI
jgi:hypothetical protein